MQTIAQKAGVSASTVSRALVNHPSIPNETRERIHAVAHSMGYRPNPLVSALMQTRRNPHGDHDLTTVALINGYSASETRALPYIRRFVDAARERAESLGYRLESFHVTSDLEAQKVDKILEVRGVQGVLIGLFPSVSIRLPMTWSRYAFAAIGFNVTYPVGHRAENDQAQTIDLALDQVHARGYRRAGLVMQVNPLATTEARFRRAFNDRQKLASVPNPIPPLEMPELTAEAFDQWFKRYKPDCVLSGAYEVFDWIGRKKLARPVGFVHTDLHLEMFPDTSQIAGLVQNYEAVGAGAFDLVDEALRRNARGIPEARKLVTFEARWKDGASLPQLAETDAEG